MVSQIARYILALILIVFGLNKFLQFLPPPEMGEAAGAYMGGLAGSGYFFPLLALTEIVTGSLLAINKYVGLALVMLAPVSLNILLFHLSMEPATGMIGYVVFILTFFLIYTNKDKFSSLLD